MHANTLDADTEQDAPRQPTAVLEAPPGLAALLVRAKTTGDNLAAMQAARLWVAYCSRRFPGRETAPVALAALQEVVEPCPCPLCHGAGEIHVKGLVSRCLRCHGSGREFGGQEHDGPLMNELLRLLGHLERTAAHDERPCDRAAWHARHEFPVGAPVPEAHPGQLRRAPCRGVFGAA